MHPNETSSHDNTLSAWANEPGIVCVFHFSVKKFIIRIDRLQAFNQKIIRGIDHKGNGTGQTAVPGQQP